MQRQEKIKAYSAWASVSFFWGTTYLAIRIGVETLPPALFAGTRFFFAGLIFIAVLRWRGYALPPRKDWLDLSIVGIALLAIANGTVVWAEQWVASGPTALIVATLPFFIVVIESLMPKGDQLTFKKVFGALLGFGGLAVLLWPDLRGAVNSTYLRAILILFIAPFAWGAGTVYAKYRKTQTPPLMAAAFQMLVAGMLLTLIGVLAGEVPRFDPNFRGMAALIYLLIFGSIVGYGSFIYALDKLPAAVVSMYAYINPVIAVVLGWLFLNERLDWSVGLSTLIILAGVVLVKLAPTRRRFDITTPIDPNYCGQRESSSVA